ncbi:hypothetical protein LIER_27733 [Lithospermum erythrorhizon]|uniref:Uncharacterized protein n=1 Tax=Lithospermum erythrorhizon TaxID=34254 RepID=A0AAV3RJ37_LITER
MEESCHIYVEVEDTLEAPQAAPKLPQSFAVTFKDQDMPEEDGDHNRPLYISGYLCEAKISRMASTKEDNKHWARYPPLGDRRDGDNLMFPLDQLQSHLQCAAEKTLDP